MKRKNVAFVVLLILIAGAFFVTSTGPLAVESDQPVKLSDFLMSLCRTVVALGDPVSGGPGSGGD